MDTPFHYPPEVMNLLVEAIPKLFRGKEQILLFFKGAGVADKYTEDLADVVRRDRSAISKREIATRVLSRLNEAGDTALRQRREVIRRITQIDDYTSCWPKDVIEAKGYVAELRRVVNVKDSFTRLQEEHEAERRLRLKEQQARQSALEKKQAELAAVRRDLGALYALDEPRLRGKALESVLNRLFSASGVLVREAFALVGDEGEGIVEQVDGVIELDGHLYLIEMKWWNKALGPADIAQHLVRLFNRGEARGIFIAAEGYTAPAVKECKEALSQKVVVLCTLHEIILRLERDEDVCQLLREKINAAVLDKNPFQLLL